MRRVPFHCKTVPYNTSTQGKQSKTLRRGTTRAQSRTTTTGHDAKKTAKNLASRQDKAQSRTTTGHDAGKTAKNLASRQDKGAIPHHNRTRRKENSKKPCVTARQGRNPAPHKTRRKENSKKLCVAARQGRNLAPQQDTTQGKQRETLRHGKTRAQSRTTTGHDAGKTKKNFASRYGKSKHHTIQDTTQRKHSKTLRRGVEEGKKLAMSSRFAEEARAGLHRVRTDGYDVDVHGFEVVAGGFIHAGVGHYSIELVCHCDEGQSSLVDLA